MFNLDLRDPTVLRRLTIYLACLIVPLSILAGALVHLEIQKRALPPRCVLYKDVIFCRSDCESTRQSNAEHIWAQTYPEEDGGPPYSIQYQQRSDAPVEKYCLSDGEWATVEKYWDLKIHKDRMERSKKGLWTVVLTD